MTLDPGHRPAPSTLPGVRYGHLASHGDVRGTFTELWRASNPAGGPDPFVQANLSTSSPGVLRGLHLHRRQLDYWVVVAGRAFVALVDARGPVSGAATAATVETRELGPNDWVVIPAGVAHGFLALEALRAALPRDQRVRRLRRARLRLGRSGRRASPGRSSA